MRCLCRDVGLLGRGLEGGGRRGGGGGRGEGKHEHTRMQHFHYYPGEWQSKEMCTKKQDKNLLLEADVTAVETEL